MRAVGLIFLLMISVVLADSEFLEFTNIPNINLTTGVNNNVIDLDNYYNGTDLFYKFKAGVDGLEGIEIDIDSEGRVDITANVPGDKSVIFIADNDTDDKESNDVSLFIAGNAIVVVTYDFFPATPNVNMKTGEKKSFAVSGEGVVAEWFLNGLKLPGTSGNFEFDAVFNGTNELKVVVGDQENIWNVVVEETVVVEPEDIEIKKISECGNGIKERGENCGNCPADVQCARGSDCKNNICVKDDGGIGSAILWFGLLGILVAVFAGGVIFAKKKGYLDSISFDFLTKLFKKKEKSLEKTEVKEEKAEVKEKIEEIKKLEEDLSQLEGYLLGNLKKGFNREELIKQALGQGWKQNQIDKVLEIKEELKPLYNYISDNLKKGFKKEDLAKQALGQGWKQEEINEVTSKL